MELNIGEITMSACNDSPHPLSPRASIVGIRDILFLFLAGRCILGVYASELEMQCGAYRKYRLEM